MRALVVIALLAAAVAAVVWLLQRYRGSAQVTGGSPVRAVAGAPAVPGEYDEPVSMLYGPEPGPGRLRLGPTQMVFAAGSGRVAVMERAAIVGVTTTRELPDRQVAKPALVVMSDEDTWYLAVANPDAWVKELT